MATHAFTFTKKTWTFPKTLHKVPAPAKPVTAFERAVRNGKMAELVGEAL